MYKRQELGRLPRVTEVPRLDFGDLDPARVLEVTPSPSRAEPVEPEHVAVALATGRGITWLAKELHIGSTKARRVKEFAQGIRAKLQELGYTIIPTYQEGYTESTYMLKEG